LGIPVLRSDLTLGIVDDKSITSHAISWYAQRHNIELPVIPQRIIEQSPLFVNVETTSANIRGKIDDLCSEGINEIIIKPNCGEQSQDIKYFTLPRDLQAAVGHSLQLSFESGAVVQKRIRPHQAIDFNWRTLAALSPTGRPEIVGRFARMGPPEQLEMIADRDMLRQCNLVGSDADQFLSRLDQVSLHAFQAVVDFARHRGSNFPHKPLGGGSYATPYFLGIDLIGDAYIMEVNGNEVAGMWTDDRLYPKTRGRSNRTVLQCAQNAARAYKAALQSG